MTNGFMGIMRAMASFSANMPRSITSTMTNGSDEHHHDDRDH
jgi:hypothetical protein